VIGGKYDWRRGVQGSRTPSLWETGHIFAASLGGSNYEPFNFIPQHSLANGDNSRWRRTESIASALTNSIFTNGMASDKCKVGLHLGLSYNPKPSNWPTAWPSTYTPTGGKYCIRLQTTKCAANLPADKGLVDVFVKFKDRAWSSIVASISGNCASTGKIRRISLCPCLSRLECRQILTTSGTRTCTFSRAF